MQAGFGSHRTGGILQTYGLDIRAAGLVVLVDSLVFGGTITSMGALYAVEVAAAPVLAYITYRIQRRWYGDDHEAALIKALVIGLLTAIPVPISAIIAGPGGALGLLHAARAKAMRGLAGAFGRNFAR